MKAFFNTSNIKTLKIDGNDIEFEAPQRKELVYNLSGSNVTFDMETELGSVPEDYFCNSVFSTLSMKPSNPSDNINNFNCVALLMSLKDSETNETETMIAPFSVQEGIDNGMLTIDNENNCINLGELFVGSYCIFPIYGYGFTAILGNVDFENESVEFCDTIVTMSTFVGGLPMPYLFENKGEHHVEFTLLDRTTLYPSMFQDACLQSIEIPSNVVTLGCQLFVESLSLTNVVLNEGLKKIGLYSFVACESLTTITIPSTVTYIGDSPFGNCDNLTEIICLAPVAPYLEGELGILNHPGVIKVPKNSDYSSWESAIPSKWTIEYVL